MRKFLVGGAVRDKLLGLPVTDRDWVVVGSSAAEMEQAGYQAIGRDFPVFLHPHTKEEYALARTERKTAKGYHGFTFHTSPNVTLEEDLQRRDLTINAMAEDENGNLIDPYAGQSDLQNKLLRHVSESFAEDPVRILRVARFHARYATLGFSVAGDTLRLMQEMVENGEASALVSERVWQELDKALLTDSPVHFFETLRACAALEVIFPEFDALFGVPQPARWHPEIDTGLHTMMVLEQVCKLTRNPVTRFATLCHDLGKAVTPDDKLPSHPGHEVESARLTRMLCARLRTPKEYRDLAVLVASYHTHVHRAMDLSASTMTKTLTALDIMRKPERFEQFLLACEADARGRKGLEHRDYPQADFFRQAAEAYQLVDAASIAAGVNRSPQCSEQIKQQIHQARVAAVKNVMPSSSNHS